MASVTTNENQKIWDKWLKSRDPHACDGLIRLYMPIVNYHVQRISVGLPKNVSKDDLISHGMLGLYDALEKFNANRDLKFDTYASFRVRGAIIDGLRKEDWLPRSMREKIKRVEACIQRLEQEYGRNVTAEEVGSKLDMSEQEVYQITNEHFLSNLLSIDERSSDSDRNESFAATIIDKQSKTPEEHLLSEVTKEELGKVISKLTEKEQLVISLFYFDELTLTEIGHVLDLSTSRISQIHSKALFRMKQLIK
jgi:RNA polymerase sigma factor FliA